MPSTQKNDTYSAFNQEGRSGMMKIVPVGTYKIENVKSFDEFKAKNIDFNSLRPGVLVGQSLIIQAQNVGL